MLKQEAEQEAFKLFTRGEIVRILKKAKIKFKKDFEDVETMQVLSSEVVYSLDSDSGTNTTYEYGDEREGTFSPYWKVTFSMASMFSDVSDKSAEQKQPVVDILVPAIK